MKNYTKIYMFLLIFVLALIVASLLSASAGSSSKNKLTNRIDINEEFPKINCAKCGSTNTVGFVDFYTKNGEVCTDITKAGYSIIHCNDCGFNLRYSIK